MMFLLCSIYGMAQSKTISGRVSDMESTLMGVTIIEQGTTNGVISDLDGSFNITVSDSTAVLEIRHIGYITQHIPAQGDNLNIVLELDATKLDEVVIIGYGTSRKSDLIGAVSSVKSKDLARTASIDAVQSLQGKIAGVDIKLSSGEPGSGTSVNIRGVGSINNSSPLYVVDGISVSDISHIAPNDIEGVEVLKDASATAIYGSQGSNGVIIIKTKGGKLNQKATVTANIYTSFSTVTNKIDMLNASEYALLKQECLTNGGTSISTAWQTMFDEAIATNSVGTDWQDVIFRTAKTQNYNFNITGGTESATYDVGVTYAREEGIVENTNLNKFMAHINNSYTFNDHVKMGVNVYYTNANQMGNDNTYYTGSLVAALRADPISLAYDPATDDFGEIYFAYGTNPARSVYENQYNTKQSDRVVTNTYLQLSDIFTEGLSFRAQFGGTLNWQTAKQYLPTFYVTADQQRSQSSLYEQRSNTRNWTTSEYFNYEKTVGKHSFNAMLGFEASMYQNDYLNVTAYDVPEDADLRYINASTSTQYLANGTLSHSSLASYFTRLNYNYDSRYLVTATVRADGSSKFVDHWGYFPSFSGAWNILNEEFMKNASTDIVSNLRMRAGWGQVGNQNAAGNHDYSSVMTNGYTYVFGGVAVDGALQQTVANTELMWETAEQLNVGIDFGLWGNKLTGSIDYFIRNTKDMIMETPVPIYSGFWKPTTNAGSLSNKGIELTLSYSNNIGKDFSYNLSTNFSIIRNNVTSIGGSDPIEGGNVATVGNTTRTEVGHEIAYFYGLETDGIFHYQSEADSYVGEDGSKIQPYAEAGDVKFVDQNGDGVINDDDRVKLGSAIPNFTMGFNASLNYKQFDFNMSLQGSFGAEIVNGMYYTRYSSDMKEWNICSDMLNRWTPDNPESDLPRLTSSDPNGNTKFSDRFVEDGTYVRISNMQIGYTIPSRISKKIKVERFRVYVSSNNLHTFTGYSGYDPEIGGENLSAGVDVSNYPIPRSFSLGCNVQF